MAINRSYGDACRLATALDVIGGRWALLVVRELLLGPKRFSDLRRGLPGASTNILSERLRELEGAGVVRRRKLPPPVAAWVYELTEWGEELESVVTRLGAWGARSPLPPAHERIGVDSIVLALRSLFDPDAATGPGTTYQLSLEVEDFCVTVSDRELELGRGTAEDPALTIEADPATLGAVLTGALEPAVAIETEDLRVEGTKRELDRFLRMFPMPEPVPA
jgi:DNA-binding HxlR family transcriptional regulator/putative sterol carrier protein